MPDVRAGEATDAAAEDAKLLTLARAAAARGSGGGAAVRDGSGRTYVAGAVSLTSLTLSPVQAAVAAAISSGALSGRSGRIEAVAVVGATAGLADLELLTELGSPNVLSG